MSAGEYDAPHMLSQLPRFEPRRASGGLPASYDVSIYSFMTIVETEFIVLL